MADAFAVGPRRLRAWSARGRAYLRQGKDLGALTAEAGTARRDTTTELAPGRKLAQAPTMQLPIHPKLISPPRRGMARELRPDLHYVSSDLANFLCINLLRHAAPVRSDVGQSLVD